LVDVGVQKRGLEWLLVGSRFFDPSPLFVGMENEGSVLLWVCIKLQSERVSISVNEARDSEFGFGWQRFRIVMWVGFVFLCFFFRFGCGEVG
jgi:hypothetical protein